MLARNTLLEQALLAIGSGDAAVAEMIATGGNPTAAIARVLTAPSERDRAASYSAAWKPQPGPQSYVMETDSPEVFYGGARGGGKTDVVIGRWLRHEQRYGGAARGLVLRQFYVDLEDFVRRAMEVFPLVGAHWNEQKATFIFPSGARLKLSHAKNERAALRFKGRSFNFFAVEEVQDWPTLGFVWVVAASMRSPEGIPVFLLLTGNPGGPGHNALAERYVNRDGAEERAVSWTASSGQVVERLVRRYADPETGEPYEFVPALLDDNELLTANDPGYENRLRKVGEQLYRAWRFGDWNVVAGAALGDVWKPEVHVVRPFEIPAGWRIDRSFDWGSSHPYSVGWWAESNGEEVEVAPGVKRSWPRGTLFQIAELYGWNGKPNEGTRATSSEIAREVLRAEGEMRLTGRVHAGPADSAIFAVADGRSVADEMARVGVTWTPANKGPGSRRNGLELIRDALSAATGRRGDGVPREGRALYFFDTCRHSIRTLPTLPISQRDPRDVDTEAEDHAYDMVRYRLLAESRTGGVASTIAILGY